MSADDGDAEVVDLASRRLASEVAACTCGSEWFVLKGRELAANGAVCLTAEGSVRGYAGEPLCIECGEPWAPAGGWRVHG